MTSRPDRNRQYPRHRGKFPRNMRPLLVFSICVVVGIIFLALGGWVGFIVLALCLLGSLGPLLAMAGMNGEDDAMAPYCLWPKRGQWKKTDRETFYKK